MKNRKPHTCRHCGKSFSSAYLAQLCFDSDMAELTAESNKLMDKIDTMAWETFCTLHPHEAYDLDREKFCKYMQKNNPKITPVEIGELIEETRDR